MGYELDKLMKQYGVATPGMANYSGAAAPVVPTAPTGTRPTGDDDAAKAAQTAYDTQLSAYNAYQKDPSAFNEMVRRKLPVTWDATNGVIAASCTDEVIAAAAANVWLDSRRTTG